MFTKTRYTRVAMVFVMAVALIVGFAAMSTSKPLLNATEVITVPNPATGEPMQLTVPKEPTAAAEAASGVFVNCQYRTTRSFTANVRNRGTVNMGCGFTYNYGANDVLSVRDGEGPMCLYYANVLAGCVSKGLNASVSNRTARLEARMQPIGS